MTGGTELPRAVACDLDGTLLRDDLTVSPRTRAALRVVEEVGILLVFVTGRPPRWIHPVADQTDHRGLAICGNGAQLYDLHTEKVVAEDLISPETLTEAIDRIRAAVPGVTFGMEYGDSFSYESAFPMLDKWKSPDHHEVPVSELLIRPGAKLILRHGDHSSDDLAEALQEVVGGLLEITHSSNAGPAFVEASAAGVTKATALARLCASHDIGPEDVVAFGDQRNDLPMLGWAGRPYAMANGHPEVLRSVERRAPSNEEDGVAVVLEEILGL
ncbi:HAD family hydrolase [Sporichthya polymorpha]|uniref:HAD family hydrolase n=1 Tax=Sporichthya polymorpha TaxID=35751 RepID=UPI0003612AFF|nr:HAD family hydrolase [Sporichthya polymorpha]